MRVDEIKKLIRLVEESEIDSLEVRRWWTVIRIAKRVENHKGGEAVVVPAAAPATGTRVATSAAEAGAASVEPPAAGAKTPVEEGLIEIRSPMVGTFYRAPSPGAPAYVEVGSRVEKGQVVCIVEAMKLMNEIEAEVSGTVVSAPVEDATPVEFNQPLFLVRPA
jgi:acetyl-CoA carboxylase biotin carboxyl carrier protein